MNWALCGGMDLIECLCYSDTHDALYNITWSRIVYAENKACDEIVRESVSVMSM